MIEKAADSFERKQRRCLDALEDPTLFTGTPQFSIAVVATPENGHVFTAGEDCRLALDDESRLLVVRGVSVIGRVERPPPSLVNTMRCAFPSALGTVNSVFSLTGMAEIQLE